LVDEIEYKSIGSIEIHNMWKNHGSWCQMALTATNFVTTVKRSIGNPEEKIRSFDAKAATSYSKGDFVTVDTDGRLTLQTADQTAIDGIVTVDVDNSLGANDAVKVPVLVKGNVFVDLMISSATYLAIGIGTQCTIAGDGGTTTEEGQAVANINAATVLPFTSLSIQALTTGAEVKKGLFFFKGNGNWC